jgi:serine/threonine protein phosphatase PrpC
LTESSIKDAFLKTEIDLIREMRCSNIDIKFSGTTTVLTYIHENKIFCANLGDSRAVVFNRNANEKWYSKELSYDHKGENPVEAQRIIINGGRIAPYYD